MQGPSELARHWRIRTWNGGRVKYTMKIGGFDLKDLSEYFVVDRHSKVCSRVY